MVIISGTFAKSPSTRLRAPAFGWSSVDVACIPGSSPAEGAAMPTYAVRVPAFLKGSAFPGVRAWSPPV